MKPEFRRALDCANHYRSLGYQPLPSKMDVKGPMLNTFAQHWESLVPALTYEEERWKTSNVQLMTGCHWKLMVVDLDGPEAIQTWGQMVSCHGGIPETWRSRTGGGGLHFYFTLPDWLDECPSRRLWGAWDTWGGTQWKKQGSPMKGEWIKHKEIRVLGDKALVIAPPSFHVETRKPYDFEVGPQHLPRPAMVPNWILMMPEIQRPDCVEKLDPASFPSEGPRSSGMGCYKREEILSAIPSKIALARRWGLKTAFHEHDTKGWWRCWAVDRDENRPSSQFHDKTGVYWCGRERRAYSLFDLGVMAPENEFSTWQEVWDSLGAEFVDSLRASQAPARIHPPARPHAS